MKVRDIMNTAPVTADVNTPVHSLALLMVHSGCGEIPLTDGGRLIGVVTDRDVACRVVAAGRDPVTTIAREVMTAGPATIGPERCITAAIRLMESAQVRRLPVVDDEVRVVGIVSMTDLCQHLPYWTAGTLLREISTSHPSDEPRPTALEAFPPYVPQTGPFGSSEL